MRSNLISTIGIIFCSFTGSAFALTELTLVKEVVGGEATATDWVLTADGTDANDLSGAGWVQGLVDPGIFELSESVGPPGYTAGDWDCVGGGTQDGHYIHLSTGEVVTCTIINTFVPPVVIFNADLALPVMPIGDGSGTPVCIDAGLLVAGCDGAVGPQGPPGPDLNEEVVDELCALYELTGKLPPPLCVDCGNGSIEPLEQCDDGNTNNGDGCSEACLWETFNLYFSEYAEGSGFNKALEIYNSSGATVDLAATNCKVRLYLNGATTPNSAVNLVGSLGANSVFVACHDSINPSVYNNCDLSSALSYTGNDAIELICNDTTMDVIGQIGQDSVWSQDQTLRRKCGVTTGDPIGTDEFVRGDEWNEFAMDDFSDFGQYVCP